MIIEYFGGPADGVQRKENPALAHSIVLCYRDDTPYHSYPDAVADGAECKPEWEGWYSPVLNGRRYFHTGKPK
ncbi:MAG TPA: hypothetical protein VKD28_12860 [Gemmatimonadales bacterium]|nr:hypothetical protein [Gemmatimonadales bacterium]